MLKSFFQSKIALGSKVDLVIVSQAKNEQVVNGIFADLWRYIFDFEKQFSRFLPNSELTQFNKSAGTQMPVTSEFRDILLVAKRLSEETKGTYNPFILPALQRAGYVRSLVPGYEKDIQADYTKLHVANPDLLKIGDNWASIPYGTAIDLGGCGKGYLADELREFVKSEIIEGYWFSVGGDIVGADLNDEGGVWQVDISDGTKNDNKWQFLASKAHFAVATSGTNIRRGSHEGKQWHHILDPTTQLPTNTDLSMVSIYGTSAVKADVFAKSAIILGSSKALPFLKTQKTVKSALLQGVNKNGQPIEVKFGREIKLRHQA